MNFEPKIITTLVGGPCDGQEVPESLFYGRPDILVTVHGGYSSPPFDEGPAVDSTLELHRYVLMKVRYESGHGYLVFAYPGKPDIEVLKECELLPKKPSMMAHDRLLEVEITGTLRY